MITSVLTVIVLTSIIGVSFLLYLLPLLVGWARHVPDIGAVAVINVLLGWTLVGWVVALAMALRSVNPAGPMVQVVQNPPPSPPPAPQLHDAGWAGPPGPPPSRPEAVPPLVFPPRSGGPGGPPDSKKNQL